MNTELIFYKFFSKGDKTGSPYYSFHEDSLLKSEENFKRDSLGSKLNTEGSQSSNVQTFSPKVDGLSPKFYHNFVSKKINSEKSFGQGCYYKLISIKKNSMEKG